MKLVTRLYCGEAFSSFDMEFKRSVLDTTRTEISKIYKDAAGCGAKRVRTTDLTRSETKYVLDHISGNEVLEVGCGDGYLSLAIAKAGKRALALDLHPAILGNVQVEAAREMVQLQVAVGNIEALPFPDRAFDTVIAAHTLEHVLNFEKAVHELVRVGRQRIIIVVPRQRYYRYTVDYHLHFFPDPEQLILRVALPKYECSIVTGDLCYTGFLDEPALLTLRAHDAVTAVPAVVLK
jgi:ubiquinone/menaquinone biosynthesis C-methylase UbiE